MCGVTVEAGPPRWTSALLLVAALALAGVGVAADPAGRLLAGAAAFVLAVRAGRDLLLHPSVRADAQTVQVVTGLRRLTLRWDEVEALRVVRDRRTPVLELDLGATIVVLGPTRLGRPPAVVLQELLALQR